MMTGFGWNDSGGGTTVPRLAAKELVRRGWEVTVFHAAVELTDTGIPYELREWQEEGVHLIGVHNRPHGLFDLTNPLRELNDPPITAAFSQALDRFEPDVVHFHNLHNLGAALIDEAAARGLASYFTTHNYWLICPRAYLLTGAGAMCGGPGDGGRCAACTGAHDPEANRRRLAEIRARAESGLTRILAVSNAVRNTLVAAGYDRDLIEVLRQAMPHEEQIWATVGRDRTPGRVSDRLTVGFLGSAYPHKGPQLLVEAAQRTESAITIRIFGEIPPRFAEHLRALDRRGVVELEGRFAPEEIGRLLRQVDAAALPSMWWDCAPLAAAECRAARIPLIVPRLGGLPEVVDDGVDGLVFDGLDPGDLARKLDRLGSEPGLLEQLQAAVPEPGRFSDYVDELERHYTGARPRQASVSPNPGPVAVRWKGPAGAPTSLSIINDQITARLNGPIQRVLADGNALDAPLPHAATVEVRQQWPPDLSEPQSGALAAIIPWEFGGVPSLWLERINAAVDELWVPSEFVRNMYVHDGVDPDRIRVIPNGVDLNLFSPGHPVSADGASRVRFLFVGGLISRKGPDILISAWKRAFAERDDVVLVVKDFGADSVYGRGDRDAILEHSSSGALPRVEIISDDLDVHEMVDLYRSADVLVHPYRGEGFAMPVLEAMACGVPVIVTGGGPTDEFCPPEAGWRINSRRVPFTHPQLEQFMPASQSWVLEPSVEHLVKLLRIAAADTDDRRQRGLAARAAAARLSWNAVADRYAERIDRLTQRRPKLAGVPGDPFPFQDSVAVRVLAVPAWRGDDRLAELLAEWSSLTTPQSSASLYLLADPAVAGVAEEVEAFVLAAAQRGGADLESCADVEVLFEPFRVDRDRRLLASVDAYVHLHDGHGGLSRIAANAATPVFEPGSGGLGALLAAASV